MEMKLLAAVADSAERAIENNVMVLDNSSSVKGNAVFTYSGVPTTDNVLSALKFIFHN